MKRNKKIGLYDSGVGGLTVLKALEEIMPDAEYLYFGDLKNMPYGEKTPEELIKIADGIFKFFEKKNVEAVVMACNTTSANVYEVLKNNYSFKIYPIIQSCAKVIAGMPVKKIGILATNATINSHAYSRELKKYNPDLEVFETACPEWVKIVEGGFQNEPESLESIKKYVDEMMKNKPDKIILGCTHYPYLMDVLAKFAPKDLFIDPSKYFAEFIASQEDLSKAENTSSLTLHSSQFYVSSGPEHFKNAAKMFYEASEVNLVSE